MSADDGLAEQIAAFVRVTGPVGFIKLVKAIPALGGGDNIRNFWPQPYGAPVWNAHVKDALEDRLHDLVCSGELDLATAQRDIARDWTAAYKKYFMTDSPLPEHSKFVKDRPWE